MNKILLLFLAGFLTFVFVFMDDVADSPKFYGGAGLKPPMSASDFKKLKKIVKVIKIDNDIFVDMCSFNYKGIK